MFVSGIDPAARFTRPIHTIARVWGNTAVIPGAATLFFVNADGWALTCKHVASQLKAADWLLAEFDVFKTERDQFSTDKKSRKQLRALEWPNGVCCPSCGSVNVQTGCQHKTMPYRCREKECKKKFSVKTGTVMECAKVSYQDWLIAAFLLMTSLKSVSSMKLHRDLGVSQKTAWFLAQRRRAALSQDVAFFAGPVEVDETYVGGRRRNMSVAKRRELADTGRGPVGKTAVVGVKDRATKHVAATVVMTTDAATLHGFVRKHTEPWATVYTDDSTAYASLPFNHATVKHSLSEYVIALEHAQTRPQGHLPQAEPEAS